MQKKTFGQLFNPASGHTGYNTNRSLPWKSIKYWIKSDRIVIFYLELKYNYYHKMLDNILTRVNYGLYPHLVWPDLAIFERSERQISKKLPRYFCFFGIFSKLFTIFNICRAFFFIKNWTTFYSTIWSHWPNHT